MVTKRSNPELTSALKSSMPSFVTSRWAYSYSLWVMIITFQVSSGLSQAIAAGGCHLVSSGALNNDNCCNPCELFNTPPPVPPIPASLRTQKHAEGLPTVLYLVVTKWHYVFYYQMQQQDVPVRGAPSALVRVSRAHYVGCSSTQTAGRTFTPHLSFVSYCGLQAWENGD